MTESAPHASRLWTAGAWLLAASVASTAAVARQHAARDQARAVVPAPPAFAGTLRPTGIIVVSLPEAVAVARVLTAVGQHVEAGQPLLELNLEDARRMADRLRSGLAGDTARLAQVERAAAAADAEVQRLTTALADVTARLAVAQGDVAALPGADRVEPADRAQAAYDRAVEHERRAAVAALGGSVQARQDLEDAQLTVRTAVAALAAAKKSSEARGRLAAVAAEQARTQTELHAAEERRRALDRDEDVMGRRRRVADRREALATAIDRAADGAIRAPRAGVIAAIAVTAGSRVAAGASLVSIASLDPMRLEIAVAPSQLDSLHQGSVACATLADASSLPMPARVATIAPLPGPGDTHAIGVDVWNPRQAPLAGRPAQVRFRCP